MSNEITSEISQGAFLADQLRTPYRAQDGYTVKDYQNGGYGAKGSGVSPNSAIDGSHALLGEQGYYTANGKTLFLKSVSALKAFFDRHDRLGKPIRLVIKAGIGGQHTPFQAVAHVLNERVSSEKMMLGEYELGKSFRAEMMRVMKQKQISIDQVAIIVSSKSGSTDETMMIFSDLLYAAIEFHAGEKEGARIAALLFEVLHDINFDGTKEKPSKDLFRITGDENVVDRLVKRLASEGLLWNRERVILLLKKVLGHMVFETTDNVEQSRLAAFIHNSGFDRFLGEDRPVFVEMYENVGGRWTGDLHMISALAYFNVDAQMYWQQRYDGIQSVRAGTHDGNRLARRVLDQKITDIALVVPDELFWFGKSIEQNFNESIWQPGFANLITIPKQFWPSQKKWYAQCPSALVINLSDLEISETEFQVDYPTVTTQIQACFSRSLFQKLLGIKPKTTPMTIAQVFAELFTTFYGMTNTVGTCLIAREVKVKGQNLSELDFGNLDAPVTRTVLEALFLRQPFVELGKKFLEKRMQEFGGDESKILKAIEQIQSQARSQQGSVFETFQALLQKSRDIIRSEQRKPVPFLYLEGPSFIELREALTKSGIPWVMQGTGDQHISYQQVLAQPNKYFPILISFVPVSTPANELLAEAKPAIGFAKGYLHKVPAHFVRDSFAEASYQALLQQNGKGVFLRVSDDLETQKLVLKAFQTVYLG